MSAYYNEYDKFAAQWLRELIKAGLIAPGEVDERSICDVKPDDLRGFTQCHFFAGIGVWSYALRRAGWDDSRPVWTGSCPCQPFSNAGQRKGFDDERHLWPVFRNLIAEYRPATVFGEQVASANGRTWLDAVRADMEAMDFAFGAADLCAAGVGAPHIRQRLFWVADTDDKRLERRCEFERERSHKRAPWSYCVAVPCRDGKTRFTEPGTSPLVDESPARVGRLRGYGNAVVAEVAATFIEATGIV